MPDYVGGARATPEIAADYARVTGSWPVYPNIDPKSQTFDFQYRVERIACVVCR